MNRSLQVKSELASCVFSCVKYDYFFNSGIDSEGHAANFVETSRLCTTTGQRLHFVQASDRVCEAA